MQTVSLSKQKANVCSKPVSRLQGRSRGSLPLADLQQAQLGR